jgi:arginase
MKNNTNTLRLLMPQWQGGVVPGGYPFGAMLTSWLAPKSDDICLEVPIKMYDGSELEELNGVVEQKALMDQLQSACHLIEAYQPDRVVIFGGDCMVEQSPIAYLNERYGGDLGVIWIDAHPDITTPKDFNHEHTMVLGNLLGEGDPLFAKEVKVKLKPEQIMFAGLQETLEWETEMINRLNLRRAWPKELADTSEPILSWIKEMKFKHVYIHLDLDVLDPKLFRGLLFAQPIPDPNIDMDFSIGEMTFDQVSRLITDIAEVTEVVGQGITEHLPWDAINLKHFLEKMPLLSGK